MKLNRALNPRKQGDAGLGCAIAWFTAHEHCVCVPLTDSQRFDLVVEMEGQLKRVFVRTTTRATCKGWACGLRTIGINSSGYKVRHFDKRDVDLLFILCGDGSAYLIPAEAVQCKSEIRVGSKYLGYKVLP